MLGFDTVEQEVEVASWVQSQVAKVEKMQNCRPAGSIFVFLLPGVHGGSFYVLRCFLV